MVSPQRLACRGGMKRRLPVRGVRFWWLIWGVGVALIPLVSLHVPRDGTPYPVVLYLPERIGLGVWAGWGAGFGLMFLGMLGLRGVRLRTAVIAQACASVAIATLTLAAPSTDAYTYVAYGEITQRGENPWQPPLVTAADDATRVATASWGNPLGPMPYGPVFALGERALLQVVPHTSTRTLLLIERCVAAFAAIGVTLLVRGPRIAFWALNPLVLFEFAGAAHNDAVMLLLIAASMRLRRPFLAGIAIGFAGMVKIVALGNLLLLRWSSLPATIAGVVLVVVALLAFVPQAATLGPEVHLNLDGPSPIAAVQKLLAAHGVARPELAARMIVLIPVVALFLATRSRWPRRDTPVYGAALLVASSPLLHPWYATWLLMPALFASRPVRGVVLASTAAVYLLNLGVFPARVHVHGITLAFWAVMIACAAYFFLFARRQRKGQAALLTTYQTAKE